MRFRFHGELNDFLPSAKRAVEFAHEGGVTDTLKHVIESLGVPHTEIAGVTANGNPVRLSDRLKADECIEVFPYELPITLSSPRFVLDGHLGRLAAYLRMLGFDTAYDRFADDPALATIASKEDRVLLTRDVGLLKRSEVTAGYCVRAHKPLEQLREISCRFGLQRHFAPFVRCMDCNGDLQPVAKEEVANLLPPHTRLTKTEFSRCSSCQKIFWRGSHHARMLGWISDLKAAS